MMLLKKFTLNAFHTVIYFIKKWLVLIIWACRCKEAAPSGYHFNLFERGSQKGFPFYPSRSFNLRIEI